MVTLTTLKKKIAALEAQVERVTRAEMDNAIAKIRKIMGDFGVTVEHLAESGQHARGSISKKLAGAKKSKASKSKKPAKYMDPKSGATWSGLGRIPAWIAKAKSRDAFLIDKPAASEAPAAVPGTKSPVKRAASKKVAKAARAVKKVGAKVTAKKSVATKTASPAKKVGRNATASKKVTPQARASATAQDPGSAES